MSVRTVEQKMSDSTVWDGAAPAGVAVLGNDMEAFPEGAVGGLFDFENKDPIGIHQVFIKFGSGTTSWTLSLVDIDSVETEIAAASDALPFITSSQSGALASFIILQGQKLKLVSAGGPTTASVARISVDQYRS